MCGIAGFTKFDGSMLGIDTLLSMGDAISHRGPDAHGEYLSEYIALCHRRLSIIDLSEQGNQPMISANGRYVIVFNGEIYNYLELRNELISYNYQFKSHTDTEVILGLYQHYGLKCLDMMNGMFAFAIWDNEMNSLFIARDRIGKKPLYYFNNNNRFIFASELKSILKHPLVNNNIRHDAIYDYFTYQYVPDPKTIYKNIFKLQPGHYLIVNKQRVQLHKYWDLSFSRDNLSSIESICDELDELIHISTKSRMISDVPLGAFLSGGIDSSAIVAYMAKCANNPVTTCSIGFNDKDFDELDYARTISEIFNTRHFEYTVQEDIHSHLIEISAFFDEPFADPSFVPTYYVSKLARQNVKVALAGDGGDENFAGYQKYVNDDIENRLRRVLPTFIRTSLFPLISTHLAESRVNLLRKSSSLLKSLSVQPSHGFFITNSFFPDSIWARIINDDLRRELVDYHPSYITEDYYNSADTDDHISRILYTDIKTYLPGDILVKVDRMSMANSLEVRAPLLDYHLVEYAARLPSNLKFLNGDKKYILKKCLTNILPKDILYRKKMGFSVPLASWLRKEIKDLAYSILFKPNNGLSNFFQPDKINILWDRHQKSTFDYSTQLWSLLIFEIWWQRYIGH